MSSDSTTVITAAKRHLVFCIRGKTAEGKHPWRRGWEFVYYHSLRVDAICQKLQAAEAPAMLPGEALALRLAAIFHDIGRLDDRAGHAALGAQMAADWLSANPGCGCDPAQVVDLIAHHSEKDQPGPTLGHALLKDADELDEIGIFSTLMVANWVNPASPGYFYDLADRLAQFEIPFCEKTAARLQTAAARAYLAAKQRFIESVIAQFALELEGIPREID